MNTPVKIPTTMTLAEANEQRARLAMRKNDLCAHLGVLNSRVRGLRLPHGEYVEIVRKQAVIKEELGKLEAEIGKMNILVSRLSDEEYKRTKLERATTASTPVVNVARPTVETLLREMIAKYQGLASDRTRVPSIRLVATEVAEELRDVLRIGVRA